MVISLTLILFFISLSQFNFSTMKPNLFSAIAILTFFVSFQCEAQFSYTRGWDLDPERNKQYEILLFTNVLAPTCELTYHQKDNPEAKRAFGDTKMKYHLGIGTGGSFRLGRLGDQSALMLNIGGLASYAKLTISNNDFKIKDIKPFEREFHYLKVTFPVSLDYISGGQAIPDKTIKNILGLGAGAAIIGGLNGIGGSAGNVQVSPFVKVEAGYFAGIAFKLRLTYLIGEQLWYEEFDATDVVPNKPPNHPHIYYKLATEGEFMLSLIIMPFSYTWEDY